MAQRLQMAPDWADYDLVFCTSLGTAFKRQNVARAFKDALNRADLPNIRLHDLRHAAATIMLEMGVSARVAADRLKHSDVALTLRRYSHVTESLEADAAARIARALDG